MPATVKLRIDKFDELTEARGWRDDKQRAEGLGVSQSTISRIRSGASNPGGMFVDRCMATFGPLAYDLLFERITHPAKADA
jgi:transcriptional regulator with XRE-family HTH domain